MDRLLMFQPLDFAAVVLLFAAWIVMGWRIESDFGRPSVSRLMAEYRKEWMLQMIDRDPRIFDAQILSSLRQGAAFFGSACMIAIGGALALLGNADKAVHVANDLTMGNEPTIVWELKVGAILILLVSAFLKFVWSNRLFGYCAVLVAAVPNDPSDPRVIPRADQAGRICISAARAFNRGLRSVYFAMAAVAWLLDPIALLIAVIVTVAVLWRREFASQSRDALMSGLDQEAPS